VTAEQTSTIEGMVMLTDHERTLAEYYGLREYTASGSSSVLLSAAQWRSIEVVTA
jgi:hypothetical protein